MEDKRYIDLHSHTIYSDGSDTPESLIRAMHMSGVDLAAVTDHDTLASYARAKAEATRHGFRIIPGVEISTTKYHLLGLNVNPEHFGLLSLLQRSQEIQLDECSKRIEKLAASGIPITLEKLKTVHPEARLGKWNIATTLFVDEACRHYLEKKHGFLPTPRVAYEHYLGKSGIAGRIDKGDTIRSQDAIAAIHESGGIAIIAHPFNQVKDIEKELSRLHEKGIDGLEIQPNYGEKNAPFRRYADAHGWLVTYGSDFHGVGYDRPLLGRREGANEIEKDYLESMLSRWR